MRRPPTSRRPARARASCWRRWSRMASSARRSPRRSIRPTCGSRRPRTTTASAISPTGRFRSSTSWSTRPTDPIDVWTTLDPGMQAAGRPGGPRQHARRRAGRAGRDRPRWRGAGDGRRQGLCRFDLQSRDPGDAPAGIGVQAVRLSRGARIGDEADRHDRRRAGHDRRLEPAQFEPHQSRARSPCARHSRARSTRSARRSAQQLGFSTIADMARRFGITTPISTYPSMVLGSERRAPDRDDPRFRVGRKQGRRGDALCDPQGRHRRWPAALQPRQ